MSQSCDLMNSSGRGEWRGRRPLAPPSQIGRGTDVSRWRSGTVGVMSDTITYVRNDAPSRWAHDPARQDRSASGCNDIGVHALGLRTHHLDMLATTRGRVRPRSVHRDRQPAPACLQPRHPSARSTTSTRWTATASCTTEPLREPNGCRRRPYMRWPERAARARRHHYPGVPRSHAAGGRATSRRTCTTGTARIPTTSCSHTPPSTCSCPASCCGPGGRGSGRRAEPAGGRRAAQSDGASAGGRRCDRRHGGHSEPGSTPTARATPSPPASSSDGWRRAAGVAPVQRGGRRRRAGVDQPTPTRDELLTGSGLAAARAHPPHVHTSAIVHRVRRRDLLPRLRPRPELPPVEPAARDRRSPRRRRPRLRRLVQPGVEERARAAGPDTFSAYFRKSPTVAFPYACSLGHPFRIGEERVVPDLVAQRLDGQRPAVVHGDVELVLRTRIARA